MSTWREVVAVCSRCGTTLHLVKPDRTGPKDQRCICGHITPSHDATPTGRSFRTMDDLRAVMPPHALAAGIPFDRPDLAWVGWNDWMERYPEDVTADDVARRIARLTDEGERS